MDINKSIVFTSGIAIVAFAAGRFMVAPETAAVAQEHEGHAHAEHAGQEHAGQEMDAAMAAAMKAGIPGEHHRHLQKMAGKWKASFTMWPAPGAPPMEMSGTIDRQWILDGHYLREEVESQTPMGTFQGMGIIGYNNMDGQYEVVWMDSMSTHIHKSTGTYDPETGIMRFFSNLRDPATGQMKAVRSELDLSTPGRHLMTEWVTGQDGREYKMFEGIVTR